MTPQDKGQEKGPEKGQEKRPGEKTAEGAATAQGATAGSLTGGVVSEGTEPDAADDAWENSLPVDPAALQPEVIGVRHGMFGTSDTGDTSGYGRLVRPVVFAAGTTRPYGGWFDEVADALGAGLARAGVPHAVEKVVVHRKELTFFIRREDIVPVVQLLRDDPALRFEFCSGISGVHYPGDEGRELHAVYHLLSMTHNRRVRLEVVCPDLDPHIPSVVAVYPTADWHERETYDFFGIIFDGHPSLTRIEMPDDWPGHPQRKDYPLGGIPVEYKGATIPPPDKRRSYN